MLTKDNKVALILKSQGDIDLFIRSLDAFGYKKITAFKSTIEAFEIVTRQNFDVFITQIEMPDMNGLVFVQKIRGTGNYGMETHLFVCDKIDPSMIPVLYEFDLPYAMNKPFTKDRIIAKFQHMIDSENKISQVTQNYRQARSAIYTKMLDMAEEIALGIVGKMPESPDKPLILLGDVQLLRGNSSGALTYFEQAHKEKADSPVAPHRIAHTLLSMREYQKAADMLNELSTTNPYNIKLLENAGLSNYNIQDYERAGQFAKQLQSLDSQNKEATTLTANIHVAKGEFDKIGDALKKTMTDREMASFLNSAGVKLAKGNDVEGALKMYQSCIKTLEGSEFLYAIYYNMGLAYKQLKDTEKAKECFETALRLKPEFEKAEDALKKLAA